MQSTHVFFSGKSWMGALLGENTGGTEGSMEEDNTLSESEVEDVSYTIHNRYIRVIIPSI